MSNNVIPFPGKPRQRQGLPRRGFTVPFTEAEMRRITHILSLASNEILDAPEMNGKRTPAVLHRFIEFCWELSGPLHDTAS